MSSQLAFRQRSDDLWYAPAIDPADQLDYTIDFTDLLAGDTIMGSPTWTVTPGITMYAPSNTTTSATVWLKNGVIDAIATVECTLVTTAGRTLNRSFKIECSNL